MNNLKKVITRRRVKRPSVSSTSSETSTISSTDSQSEPWRYIDGRRYLNDPDVPYPFPVDEIETDRLHIQHYACRHAFNNKTFSAPVAEILHAGNARVLDVGTGPGTWILENATEFPNSYFTGIDVAELFPTEIKPENVHFIQMNFMDGLPFPDESFDFVHMRLMYLAFTRDQWDNSVVPELVRVLKPGGYIELTETDALMYNEGPATKLYIDSLRNLLQCKGFHQDLSPHIPRYLKSTGCFSQVTHVKRRMPLGSWAGKMSKMFADQLAIVHKTFKYQMAALLNITPERWCHMTDALTEEIEEYRSYALAHCFYAQKLVR